MKGRLDNVTLVSDKKILNTTKQLIEIKGIIAEPSSIAALAAANKLADKLKEKKAVING